MKQVNSIVHQCLNVTPEAADFLCTIASQISIVADLSRADILLYGRKSGGEVAILAHAQPRSIARVYNSNREGKIIPADKRPEVIRVLTSGRVDPEHRSFITEGAPVVRHVFPVYFPPPLGPTWDRKKARLVGALGIVTNLIEHERHRLRSTAYREVTHCLQQMVLRGRLLGAENLSPFGEHDGIIFTDNGGTIRYVSGVGANLHRHLGYNETLIGRHLAELDTQDELLRQTVMNDNLCREEAGEEGNRYWIRKALPVIKYPDYRWHWLSSSRWFSSLPEHRLGILIAIHDATDARRQDQELQIKNAMIQEVHHRVKNNLQTIAGLVRMQSRRIKSAEAKTVLDETLNRVLSVAIIHEFLSNDSSNVINIRDVSKRVVGQLEQGMLTPEQNIRLTVSGDSIYLPARQATACSLIINELVQNSLEHAFVDRKQGTACVNLQDGADKVIITVVDNGIGEPEQLTAQLAVSDSLGWQIVKILVEGDLRGEIQITRNDKLVGDNGVAVNIIFSKSLFEGEKGWKEHVS